MYHSHWLSIWRAMEALECQNHAWVYPSNQMPLTIVLPYHVRLFCLVHTCGKHSCVSFVHGVRDLVWKQVGCGRKVKSVIQDSSPPSVPPPLAGSPPGLLCT